MFAIITRKMCFFTNIYIVCKLTQWIRAWIRYCPSRSALK